MIYMLYRIISTILSVVLGRLFRNMSFSEKLKLAKAYIR